LAKWDSIKVFLAGGVIIIVFYLLAMPMLVNYFDASSLPIWIRFILYELVAMLMFFFFVSLLRHQKIHDYFTNFRYAGGLWAIYHFIDWAEAPWALSTGDIITKTPAWSVSSDTLGASILCQCQDVITHLTCNVGCFDKVNIIVPLGFLGLALLLFGKEITTFIKNIRY
jgi:hypothetical protein